MLSVHHMLFAGALKLFHRDSGLSRDVPSSITCIHLDIEYC